MSNDRDEAIRLSMECNICILPHDDLCGDFAGLEAFYLAAKAKGAEEENEACAKICENMPSTVSTVYECADEIRARKGKKCST